MKNVSQFGPVDQLLLTYKYIDIYTYILAKSFIKYENIK